MKQYRNFLLYFYNLVCKNFSVYNLLNMAGIDTDSADKPLNPPKILTAVVAINPFDDIVVRNLPP